MDGQSHGRSRPRRVWIDRLRTMPFVLLLATNIACWFWFTGGPSRRMPVTDGCAPAEPQPQSRPPRVITQQTVTARHASRPARHWSGPQAAPAPREALATANEVTELRRRVKQLEDDRRDMERELAKQAGRTEGLDGQLKGLWFPGLLYLIGLAQGKRQRPKE